MLNIRKPEDAKAKEADAIKRFKGVTMNNVKHVGKLPTRRKKL